MKECGNQCDGTRADAELEPGVHQYGPPDPRHPALGEPCTEREAAHVGGEHRRDRELGSAEHECEQARPCRLIEESRQTAEQETGGQ